MSSVFACCGQDTVVQASMVSDEERRQVSVDFRNLVTLALYHVEAEARSPFCVYPSLTF